MTTVAAAPPSIFEPDVPWPETLVDRVMRTRLCVADIFHRALEQELTTQAAQIRQEREAVKLRRVTSTAFLHGSFSGGGSSSGARNNQHPRNNTTALSSPGRGMSFDQSSAVFDDESAGLDLAGKILRAVEVEVIKEVQKLADGLPRFLASQKTTASSSSTAAAAAGSRHASSMVRQHSMANNNYWSRRPEEEGDNENGSFSSVRRFEEGESNGSTRPNGSANRMQGGGGGSGGGGTLNSVERQELRETQIRLHDTQALLAEQQHHIDALKAFCIKKDSAMNYIRSTIFTELSIVKEQLRVQQEDPQYVSNFVTIFDAWKVMEGDDPSGGKEQAVKMAKAEAAAELAKAHATFGLQQRQKDEEIMQLRNQLEQKTGELAAAALSASPKKGGKKGSVSDSGSSSSSTFLEQFQAITKELAHRDVQLADAESDIKMLRAQITTLEQELSQHVDQQAKNEMNTRNLVSLRDAEISAKCQLIDELEQKLVHFDQMKSKMIFLEKALESSQSKYDTESQEWLVKEETMTKSIEQLTDATIEKEAELAKVREELVVAQREAARAVASEQLALSQTDADQAKLVADLRHTLSSRTAELEVAQEHLADVRTESLQMRQQIRHLTEQLEGSGKSPRAAGSNISGGGGGGDHHPTLLGEPSHALMEQANIEAKILVEEELKDVKKTLDVVRAENDSLRRQLTTMTSGGGGGGSGGDPFSSISFEVSTNDAARHPSLPGRRTLTSTSDLNSRAQQNAIGASDDEHEVQIPTTTPATHMSNLDDDSSQHSTSDNRLRQLRREHQQLKKAAAEFASREQVHLAEIERLNEEVELLKKKGVQKAVDSLLHKPVATYAFDGKQSAASSTRALSISQHGGGGAKKRLSVRPAGEEEDVTMIGVPTASSHLSPRDDTNKSPGDVLVIPSALSSAPRGSGTKSQSVTPGSLLTAAASSNRRRSAGPSSPLGSSTLVSNGASSSPVPGGVSGSVSPRTELETEQDQDHRATEENGAKAEEEDQHQAAEIKWLRERVLCLEADLCRVQQELEASTMAASSIPPLPTVTLVQEGTETAPEVHPILTSDATSTDAALETHSQQTSPITTGPPAGGGVDAFSSAAPPARPPTIPSTRPQSAQSDASGSAGVIASYEAGQAQALTAELEAMREMLAQSERRCAQLLADTMKKKRSAGSVKKATTTVPVVVSDDGVETEKWEGEEDLPVSCDERECQTDLLGYEIEQLLAVALSGTATTVSSPSRYAAKQRGQPVPKPSSAGYTTTVEDRRVVPGSRKPSLLQRQPQQESRQENQQFFIGGDSSPLMERRPSSAAGIMTTAATTTQQTEVKRAASALANNSHSASSLPPRPNTAVGFVEDRSQQQHVVTTALPSTLPNMIGRAPQPAGHGSSRVGHHPGPAAAKVAERIVQARSASSAYAQEGAAEDLPTATPDVDGAERIADHSYYQQQQQVTLVRGFGDASKYPARSHAGGAPPGTILAIATHHNAVGLGGTTNVAAKQLATELLAARKALVDSSGLSSAAEATATREALQPHTEGGEAHATHEDAVVPVEKLFPMAVLDTSSDGDRPAVVDCRAQLSGFYLGYGKDAGAIRGVKEKIRQSINVEAFMSRMMPTVQQDGGGLQGAATAPMTHDSTFDRWNVSGLPTGTTISQRSTTDQSTPTPAAGGGRGQHSRPASGPLKPPLKPSPNSAVPVTAAVKR